MLQRLIRLGFVLGVLTTTVLAQEGQPEVIEIRIEGRKVVARLEAIRISEGNEVELHWRTDEQVALHLHGYDPEFTSYRASPPS